VLFFTLIEESFFIEGWHLLGRKIRLGAAFVVYQYKMDYETAAGKCFKEVSKTGRGHRGDWN
jgi:hypothetical protein